LALLCSSAQALDRRQLAVIVNTADPLSVKIADYYEKRRQILFPNVIRVAFEPGGTALSREEFERIKAQVDAQALPQVQAFALAWAAPYRVECMSITAAFAFRLRSGVMRRRLQADAREPLFQLAEPLAVHAARPAPGHGDRGDVVRAGEGADRSRRAGGRHSPQGHGYLLSTSDAARNVRSASYPAVSRLAKGRLAVKILKQDVISARTDVLFYFTGLARVDGLRSIRFLPGAIGDHLTSVGGILTENDSGQMSALRWLEAGATGSYGTVVEPLQPAAEISASRRSHRALSRRRYPDRGVLEKRAHARPGNLHRRAARGAVLSRRGL